MSVPVDSIKVGELLVATELKMRRRRRRATFFGEGYEDDEEEFWDSNQLNGRPVEVMAINPPFIVVRFQNEAPHTLDVRHVRFARGDEKYRRAYLGQIPSKRVTRENRSKAVSECLCGRCGGRMTERLLEAGSGRWGLVCPICDAPKKSVSPFTGVR